MNRSTVANRQNLELIEHLYDQWRADPDSVEESWKSFFQGYELGITGEGRARGGADSEASQAQAAVTRLIDAYREMGHYLANLDPLGLSLPSESDALRLDIAEFGLTEADLDRTFYHKLSDPPYTTLRELIAILRETYCGSIGVEYMHIRDVECRNWLCGRMESTRNQPRFDKRKKNRIIYKLNSAEQFETFLHSHFVNQKRFGLEGGETLIPLMDAILERSGKYGVQDVVIGMSHRGRLNVLANTLNKPYNFIFSEFKGNLQADAGDGDVKYHLGFSSDHRTAEGQTIHVTLTPNPSHLEAVNPVVEGRVRAKQRRYKDRNRSLGLPILIHGDAAFSGQGLVTETLNLSQLPGYKTGGTIHIVVNNQIGFTTSPSDGRSTRYCTDVAKMLEVPIFHVNGDDPEATVLVGELADDFRQTFGKDVIIDMVCYRRRGHNEVDEPAFTQPVMYAKIKELPSVKTLYTNALIQAGDLTQDEAETIAETFREKMQAVYDEIQNPTAGPKTSAHPGFNANWKGFRREYSFAPVATGVAYETLKRISETLAKTPEGFSPVPKVQKIYLDRAETVATKGSVDWAFAETLAFGSLVVEKTPVRLSGQDCRRGTFSQRHSSVVDLHTGERFVPLNHLAPDQAEFCAYDSLLSEAAVLGFDYGYSLDDPRMLILWEAQFGDFSNGAQVIIDQFIASAESKWGRASGLVMLLPHGYEGQGPEHSSARLERFLQLCAEDNIQVVNASTPAQYFHLLRRQMKRDFRKPLIVMTPKSMLRLKEAASPVEDLVTGRFQEVIDDVPMAQHARRVLFCSGQVYYDLLARRQAVGKTEDVAIVRVEQLYPWPADALKGVVQKYRDAEEWVWVQEESQNMGAWSFVSGRLPALLDGARLDYAGRDESASPATGSYVIHNREQAELVDAAIGMALPYLVHATAPLPAVALTSKD